MRSFIEDMWPVLLVVAAAAVIFFAALQLASATKSAREACEAASVPYASRIIDGGCYRATAAGGWEPVEVEP